MKNIISIIFVFVMVFFSKAQQVPIETDLDNITNGMHLKDFNNMFNKYEGTWIANVGNKQVKLVIEKVQDRPILNYYSDALLLRYEVKVNGQVVESTLGITNNDVKIIYDGPINDSINNTNVADFFSHGSLCGVGWGWIYLTYIDTTHLSWVYNVQGVTIIPDTCSDVQAAMGTKINLPYAPDNIIFTKQ